MKTPLIHSSPLSLKSVLITGIACALSLSACSSNDSADSSLGSTAEQTHQDQDDGQGGASQAPRDSMNSDISTSVYGGAEAGQDEGFLGDHEAAGGSGPQENISPEAPPSAHNEGESREEGGLIIDEDEDPIIDEEDDPTSNPFVDTTEDVLSTFSVDVDTASYTMTRRSLQNGALPQPDRVRIEEFVNFFGTRDIAPSADAGRPFHVNLEGAPSPFGEDLHLLRVGVKGFEISPEERQGANLVFLVDVSGSMNSPGKLDLVRYSLNRLIRMLKPTDTLSIVTYASRDEVILTPTPVSERSTIIDALAQLTSGGGTNGAAGIETAYQLADQARIEGGINRVILCTDGDFNVGISGETLVQRVESWRDRGVQLTVLGYGNPNRFNDDFLQELSQRAEGNYSFIDSPNEALRVLGDRLVGTLQVIAKDVKIQVEFNPEVVERFRLIGYENRILNHEDFEDDTVDAGEIGSGHTVIALYELDLHEDASDGDIATVRVRHKEPAEGPDAESVENAFEYAHDQLLESFEAGSEELRFSAAVAEFAEILRHSPHTEGARFDRIIEIANEALWWIDGDPQPDREEFVELVELAQSLWTESPEEDEESPQSIEDPESP